MEREVADMTASQASAKAEVDKLREAQQHQDGYQFAGQSFTVSRSRTI